MIWYNYNINNIVEFHRNKKEVYHMKRFGKGILAIGVIGLCILSIAVSFDLSVKNNESYDEISQCILEKEEASQKADVEFDKTAEEIANTVRNQKVLVNKPFPSIGLRSGILDFRLKNLAVEGDEATANVEFVGYHVWLEKESEGKYLLTMTMSQYENIYVLKRANNIWSIAEVSQCQQNFAPDSFERVKGTYAMPEEALTAAEKIDVVKENPFHSFLGIF